MTSRRPQPELEATGERLIPEACAGELVLAEHLARYYLAARLGRGRRVLDAACGEGYGSSILTQAGARVCGVDLAPDAVEHALRRYGLDFRVADVTDLPFEDGTFDLAVSFETLEHVGDPQMALDEFARVLVPDGVLIVSTPNPAEYLIANPFHLRELPREEFRTALEDRFPAVRLLHQQNVLASVVFDEERLALEDPAVVFALEARKVAGITSGRELYSVALCGRGDLPALDADVAVLSSVYEAHSLAARTTEAERIQAEWQARATQAERNQAEWSERAIEAERLVAKWQARATEAERQNAELRATLDRIAASLSWRVTRPLRAVKSATRQ